MLLLLLAFGPLAFACTRPAPLAVLSWGLHLVAIVWILALLVERRAPSILPVAWVSAVFLIGFAWLRLWLIPGSAISDFTSNHFARIYDRWPESIILRTPGVITLFTSGLLFCFLVATDLTLRSFWRRGLLLTMVAVGCVVVTVGLVQNLTHAPGIFWQNPKNHMPSPFFGPFYHFTSAGAFLNLTWPIAASMALYSLKAYVSRAGSLVSVFLWGALSALLLLGHAGHVSRFPQVIALAVLTGLILVQRPLARVTWSWRFIVLSTLVMTMAVAAALWIVERTGRIHDITARWQMLNIWGVGEENLPPPSPALWPKLMRDDLVVPYDHSHFFLRDRGAAYAFAFNTALRRPFLGFGPGGWMAAVSQYATDPTVGTFYLYLQFAHEDYLQAWIEWGSIACLFWLSLTGLGIYRGVRQVIRDLSRGDQKTESMPWILGALAALFAVLVQSFIDFPLQIPANALYASILLAVCWSSAVRDSLSASSTKHVHEQ